MSTISRPFNYDYVGLFRGVRLYSVPPVLTITPRSWRERLFSKPWRPWVKENKAYVDTIKDGDFLELGGAIFANEKTMIMLKRGL